MSPERTAVIAIVAKHETWHVEDHASSKPGTGQGRALRALVLPQVLAFADERHVAILTTAANKTLAAAYAAEVPGLVDDGPGYPRGRRMRRAAL